MDYSRLAHALRHWWYVVVACVVLGLGAGLVYLKVAPEQFTARADVMIAVSGQTAVDLSSGGNFAQQQARNLSVVASRQRVLDPVVRRLNLPQTASALAARLTATVPANTSIVTLQVSYPSAAQATAIVNAVADSLVQTSEQLLPAASTGSSVALRTIYQDAVPTVPSSPSTPTAILVGLFGGLAVGIAVVVVLEIFRPRRTGAGPDPVPAAPAAAPAPGPKPEPVPVPVPVPVGAAAAAAGEATTATVELPRTGQA